MVALALPIGPSDSLLPLDSPLTVNGYPSPYVIGSELIEVHGGSGTASISVNRGVLGTAAVAHAQGTAVTALDLTSVGGGSGVTVDNTVDPPFTTTTLQFPAGTVSDAGGGTAAVGLSVRLLGPFHITYQTVDLMGTGAVVGDSIPAGAVIVRAWMQPTVEWAFDATDGSQNIYIFATTSGQAATQYPLGIGSAIAVSSEVPVSDRKDYVLQFPISDTLSVNFDAPPANVTAGEADIYAIIATPAA